MDMGHSANSHLALNLRRLLDPQEASSRTYCGSCCIPHVHGIQFSSAVPVTFPTNRGKLRGDRFAPYIPRDVSPRPVFSEVLFPIAQEVSEQRSDYSSGISRMSYACGSSGFAMVTMDLSDAEEEFVAECSISSSFDESSSELFSQVRGLQLKLAEAEVEKDHLRKEGATQRRELTNLRKSLQSATPSRTMECKVTKLQEYVSKLQCEREYFVREIAVLESKIEKMKRADEKKNKQLKLLERFFSALDDESKARLREAFEAEEAETATTTTTAPPTPVTPRR